MIKDTHNLKLDELIHALDSSDSGLTQQEADARLLRDGKNELAQQKKKSLLVKFLLQFKDVMIIVLLVAAAVSGTISIIQGEYSELIDAGIILFIVLLNAVIGLVQENKAETALESLKSMNRSFAKVLRDGETKRIPGEELTIGDIVILEAGDIVPADLRLVFSSSLKIEEAALTGESVPSEKDAECICPIDAPLGDRNNMAFSGGIVTYGRGRGIVVGIGMNTEVGKIATMLTAADSQTSPLQKQLGKTATLLSVLVIGIALVIFGVSALRGDDILEAFMTAVAIAVAAIPEGLPAVVTIVLAMGVQKMSKRNAIIKNLPAVETLGCCEIICSDKTGTLTLNQMTVKKLYTFASGLTATEDNKNSYDMDLLVRGAALCNDTEQGSENMLYGDPTETALVAYATDYGFDYAQLKSDWNRIDEMPFDSVRKMMSTVNQNGDNLVAHIKGAPDLLLDKCAYVLDKDTVRKLTTADITAIKKANSSMANQALRVLGVAVKNENLQDKATLESELTFVGLIGMIDPPRKEVKDAVRVCSAAGMRAIMITGDHADTAAAIATEIGILRPGDKVMLGREMDELSDTELYDTIEEYSVFARVSPENKVRIVECYQKKQKIVAMTGDGVNDAPSIKRADIGIGMGITGTDVSKGAADLVLADDNFATIINAVEEGRKIFTNIKKAIQFLLSANIAEVLSLFIATIFLKVQFLTPVMILWVNLITDSLPALSLGMEKAEKDVMLAPPRKSQKSLFAGRTGVDILLQGAMQTGLVMLSFCIGNYILSDGIANHSVAMTMAFVSLSLIQLFHSFNMRSTSNSIFGGNPFDNKYLDFSFIIGAVLTVIVVAIPGVGVIFDTTPLNIAEWGIAVGVAALIIPLVEMEKLIEKLIIKLRNKQKRSA